MTLRCFILALIAFPLMANAQMPQLHAGEIASGLQKLGVNGSVLYMAAHPDDENTRLLAYLAKEVKVRTGYLSLTRGDGGQNLIGNEQAELLGLIRTQELLAARRTDGAEQFFSRANDFGFSKTSEETFKIWGKDQILADAVWVIRNFKPNVIITRFPEDSRAGHGHHAASAIVAREAFEAAADPKRFPEQLKYVTVWKAKRLLWNTFNFGGNNTTSPDQLKVNVGLYNPLLGRSYGEIAAISRTNHKSQGFGSTLQRGEAYEFFSHVAGEPAKSSIFEGIDLSIPNTNAKELIGSLQKEFNASEPWLSIPKLTQLKKILPNTKLIDELILACAGIYVEATVNEPNYTLNDDIPVKIQIVKRSPNLITSISIADKKPIAIEDNVALTLEDKIMATEISQPYWLAEDHPIGQYVIDSQQKVGFPENPNALTYTVSINVGGQPINLSLPINYKFTDPVKGERYQPIIIAPWITASLTEKAYIFNGTTSQTINVLLKSFRGQVNGTVKPMLPKGWKSVPEEIKYSFNKKMDEQTLKFIISPQGDAKSGEIDLLLTVPGDPSLGEKTIESYGSKTISYDHIPTITLFPRAEAKLEKVNLQIAGKKIGYIDGAGDLVAESLKQIGYEVTHLTPFQIINNDLSSFDAIVTGVRLYNVSEDIKLMQPKLLSYVEKGGTLLVQYNVNNGLKIPDLGPYPFKLANRRVTEEDAKVEFIAPTHPALNFPNKISSADFEGWIQERGLYFATDIDPRYTTIFKMNDKGEASSDGSLLIADYGKGKYVYTSLSLFRELPAGIPGAYRLIANLLAPKKRP